MSGRKLLNYAIWATFMVTGTLFVASLVRGDQPMRSSPSDPGFKVSPRPGAAARAVPIHIDVYEFGFSPSNTIIKVGQAVAFRDVGKQIHNIVPASQASKPYFEEAERASSARPVFTQPGVFPFTCTIHPRMKGTVTVVRRF